MRAKAVSGTMLTLLLTSMLTLALNIQLAGAEPATIIVPDDYGKIQWAIGNASGGDTVFVKAGIYYERVTIRKSLTLIGENKSTTVVNGNGATDAIYVWANNVTISGFTIKNGFVGILLTGSSNCNITGNVLSSNYEGIHVRTGDGHVISGNNITSSGGDSIYMVSSHNNTIDRNIITSSGRCGIWLGDSMGAVLADNTFSRARIGIFVDHSTGATVTRNLISHNQQGLILRFASESFLRNNNITQNLYNLQVYGKSLPDFTLDLDTSNTVNGKPVYYLINKEDFSIDPSTFSNVGYLGLVNSKNIIVRDLSLIDNYEGVLFAHTSNSVIQNVTVRNNFNGIHLCSSDYNKIISNKVSNDKWGILISHSKNNTVDSNIISNNVYGFYVKQSHDNIFSDNLISNNSYDGIHLEHSDNNLISLNTLIDNGYGGYTQNHYGIFLESTKDNRICRNNFINNAEQVWTYNSTNSWDNSHPSGGNYWSDYAGVDTNGDGIGDTSYVIDEDNQDNYPFVMLWSPVEEVPFWMQWWFWTIVVAGFVVLAGAIYFLKKRKLPTPTAPILPSEGTETSIE